MYAKSARENIRTLATLYASANGMSLEAVSRKIYGNVQFIPRFLKDDRSVSVHIADKLIERFSENWPRGVPWPPLEDAIITRPVRLRKRSQNGK